MKRIGIALGLLILMAVTFAFHVRCLGQLTGTIISLLTQAEEQIAQNHWSNAESLTRHALEEWTSHDFYLHSTMRHTDTDAILVHFHQVMAFLEGSERQPAEYAAANAQLIQAIRLLHEAELPTLENIF